MTTSDAAGASKRSALTLTLQLVDSVQGIPLRVWRFQGRSRISIGRDDEVDVLMAEAVVSRLHAELVHDTDGWQVVSHGRNGTLLDGEHIKCSKLRDGDCFRLGPTGPLLRFFASNVAHQNRSTVSLQALDPQTLEVDAKRTDTEVTAVLDTIDVSDLRARAQQLRANRGRAES